MLYIIGLGVGDEGDVSLKGLDACRLSDEVYAELYTAKWKGSLARLGHALGKKIKTVNRHDLEEGSAAFVRNARKHDVCLLVPGDPLTATTHINLLMDARKLKVKTRIIHSSSILTAVAETGLNLYNFGKTATVVRPGKKYAPTSFYDTGVANLKLGMHTLFLLDIDMDTADGLRILLDIDKRKKGGMLKPGTKVIAASGIGTIKSAIRYDSPGNLIKHPLPPPAVIVVPGKLHFVEREFLDSL